MESLNQGESETEVNFCFLLTTIFLSILGVVFAFLGNWNVALPSCFVAIFFGFGTCTKTKKPTVRSNSAGSLNPMELNTSIVSQTPSQSPTSHLPDYRITVSAYSYATQSNPLSMQELNAIMLMTPRTTPSENDLPPPYSSIDTRDGCLVSSNSPPPYVIRESQSIEVSEKEDTVDSRSAFEMSTDELPSYEVAIAATRNETDGSSME